MMENKYEVLTNNATKIIFILDKMFKLAEELNLTDKITVKLTVAKNLVTEIKSLIDSNANNACSDQEECIAYNNERLIDYCNMIKPEGDVKTETYDKAALTVVDTKIELDNSSSHALEPEEETDSGSSLRLPNDGYVSSLDSSSVVGQESLHKKRKKNTIVGNNNMKLAEALADYLALGSITGYAPDAYSICNALEAKQYPYFTRSKLGRRDEVIYTCQICHDENITYEMLQNHFDVHFYRTDCSICRIRLFRFQVEKHKDIKHKKKCIHCEALILHTKIEAHEAKCSLMEGEEGKMMCVVCRKVYTKNHLRKHMQQHNLEPNISCDLCMGKYRTESDLLMHKKRAHCDMISCDICGASLKGEMSLRQHMKLTHLENRDYTCDQCGRSFKGAQNLKLHKISHSDEKQFSCDLCSKRFKYQKGLRTHLRAHRGELICKCVECGKSFSQQGSLRLHMKRVHNINKILPSNHVSKPTIENCNI